MPISGDYLHRAGAEAVTGVKTFNVQPVGILASSIRYTSVYAGEKFSPVAFAGGSCGAITKIGNIYVAAGTQFEVGNRIYTSTDGTTWTLANTPSVPIFGDIASSGTMVVIPCTDVAWVRTTDGINFTEFPSPLANSSQIPLIYGGGLFVTGGIIGGPLRYATSLDGITWSVWNQAAILPDATTCLGDYGNGLYIIPCGGGNQAIRTANPAQNNAWTLYTVNASFTHVTAIKYSTLLSLWIALGTLGQIATSTDGITWTMRTTPTSSNLWNVLDCGNVVIAVGINNTILKSYDGITWSIGDPTTCIWGTAPGFYYDSSRSIAIISGDNAGVATFSTSSNVTSNAQIGLRGNVTIADNMSIGGLKIFSNILQLQAGVKSSSGTVAAPAYTFSVDTTLGLYRPAANQLGVSIAGTLVGTFVAGGLTLPTGKILTNGDANLMTSNTAYTNNAGAQAATLLNSPTAGNPTKWIPINDNGTIRNIPAW